jgi:predicted GIY-YIG superfamily endonuclease
MKEKRFAVYVISNARQTLCVGVTDTLLEGFRPLHNDGEHESRNASHLSLGMLHLCPSYLLRKFLYSLLCKRSAV